MSISSQSISEKLIPDYVKTPPSLKDQTLTKLSIQLCAYSYLKDHIIYNPEPFNEKLYTFNEWKNLLAKQSSAVCDTLLPYALRAALNRRIRSIAISLLQWNREYHIRLAMPPYNVHELLTPSDWTVEGKIKERIVAERIVQNEDISVSKRYELACLHFLENCIFSLWNQMEPKDRERHFLKYYDLGVNPSDLVQLWSKHFMRIHRADSIENMTLFRQYGFHAAVEIGHRSAIACCLNGRMISREELVNREDPFWEEGFKISVQEGRRSTFIYCWNMLSERKKQKLLFNNTQTAFCMCIAVRKNAIRNTRLVHSIEWNPTPEQVIDIFFFLFSCMSDEQKTQFFREIFTRYSDAFDYDTTFSCFLEYPYRSYFMSIISKVWGILPEAYYGRMIITMAQKHISNMNQEKYQDHSYGDLLLELLDTAPENYKSYVFSDKSLDCVTGENNVGMELMFLVLKMPFGCRNIEIIRHILKHVPEQEKQSNLFSEWAEDLVKYFNENKKLTIMNSILKDWLPEEIITVFRKKFVLSLKGKKVCFRSLAEGNIDAVHSLLNWGHFSDEDVLLFKPKLIDLLYFTEELRELLENVQFDSFHRVLDWCLPSNDARKQFKDEFLESHALTICSTLLERSKWRNLMKFLSWAYPSDRVLYVFKRELFVKNHCGWIVRKLIKSNEEVDFLIEWWGLSENEITQVKDAMFSTDVMYAEDDEEKKKLILKMCYQLRDNYLLEIASERLHDVENRRF